MKGESKLRVDIIVLKTRCRVTFFCFLVGRVTLEERASAG